MYKREEIFAHHVGLVYRKGYFTRVLTPGKYWLKANEVVILHDTTKSFSQPTDFDILIQNEAFLELVEIHEIHENKLAVHYKDGLFHRILPAGKYANWKGVIKHDYRIFDITERRVPKAAGINKWPKLVNLFTLSVDIQAYQKALLLVDGHLEEILKPGQHHFWKNDEKVEVMTADMRSQPLEISGQELLTKDKVALRINFHASYQIVDIEMALLLTKGAQMALYLQLQMALREYIGTLTMDELLAKKEAVADHVLKTTVTIAQSWGLELITVGIRDIILPGDIKEIMNQVLVAEKKAQANTITRREETASTRSLLNTAKLMEENQMLWKLKEMEYVEKIAEKINSISLSGGTQVVDQLRQIFVAEK